MMNRLFFIMLGAVITILGVSIIMKPAFYDSQLQFYFDFAPIKWPFGGGLIILGVSFLWSSFRKEAIEAEKKAKEEKKIYMCPRCVKPFRKKDCPALKCPDCGSQLEELAGFYERHPELKETE